MQKISSVLAGNRFTEHLVEWRAYRDAQTDEWRETLRRMVAPKPSLHLWTKRTIPAKDWNILYAHRCNCIFLGKEGKNVILAELVLSGMVGREGREEVIDPDELARIREVRISKGWV